MNLVDKLTQITNRLKDLTGKVDIVEFRNTRYRQEIKHVLTINPGLKDFFSDATKKEAGIAIP